MNNKGMTLVEMIVSLLITSIITVAVLQFCVFSANMYENQTIQNEQLIVLEHIEQTITDYLRYATHAEISKDTVNVEPNNKAIYTEELYNALFYIEYDSAGAEIDRRVLAGGASSLGYDVSVEFTKMSDEVLAAYITIKDSSTNNSVSKMIYIKLLNFSSNILNSPNISVAPTTTINPTNYVINFK